jgi:hypothetical protein
MIEVWYKTKKLESGTYWLYKYKNLVDPFTKSLYQNMIDNVSKKTTFKVVFSESCK